jgi:hypothetical protein
VTAWIGGNACGSSQTREVSGKIVYVFKVPADDGGTYSGCGASGRTISFKIDGKTKSGTVTWDNSQATLFNLKDTPTVPIITDTWAIQLSPAADPNQLATELGWQNLGQIGSLSGYYLFRIPGSDTQTNAISAILASNPLVLWFGQQETHQQSKRDTNLPVPTNQVVLVAVIPTINPPDDRSLQNNAEAENQPTVNSSTAATEKSSSPAPLPPVAEPVSTPVAKEQTLQESIPNTFVQTNRIPAQPSEYSLIPSVKVKSITTSGEQENKSNKVNNMVWVMSIIAVIAGGILLSRRRKIYLADKTNRSE